MLLRSRTLRALVLLSAATLAGPALAQDPSPDPAARGETESAQKGYDIAARSDRTDQGFGKSEVAATMTLKNAAGQERSRELLFRTLEKEDESVGDKSLVVFRSPRDVEGTILLSHAKILDPDDQWLWLPQLNRERRIVSGNKSGPFVGSEFAYEDFTSTELNKYTYNYVGTEELDGMSVDVVERFPRYEDSGYTKQVGYTDQDVHQLRKVDFYDRKGSLLKTLTLSDYRDYDGIWRPHRMEMVNQQNGKSTVIEYGDYDFGVDLDADDFEKWALARTAY